MTFEACLPVRHPVKKTSDFRKKSRLGVVGAVAGMTFSRCAKPRLILSQPSGRCAFTRFIFSPTVPFEPSGFRVPDLVQRRFRAAALLPAQNVFENPPCRAQPAVLLYWRGCSALLCSEWRNLLFYGKFHCQRDRHIHGHCHAVHGVLCYHHLGFDPNAQQLLCLRGPSLALGYE